MINFSSTSRVQRYLSAAFLPTGIFVAAAVAMALSFAHVLDFVKAFFEARGVSAHAFYLMNFAALLGARLFASPRRS